MLLEEGFQVTSVDASDKMLKYALKERWERRKEEPFDRWGAGVVGAGRDLDASPRHWDLCPEPLPRPPPARGVLSLTPCCAPAPGMGVTGQVAVLRGQGGSCW